MKAYRLFIHNNFGADGFDYELIEQIVDALSAKGILYGMLKPDWHICWKGEPGEELDFDTCGFCPWPGAHDDMMEISRQFPKCSFCLREVEDDLMFIEDHYFLDGTYTMALSNMEEPANGVW